MTPEKLLYTKTHEWVPWRPRRGEKIATVGITAFALKALTDLVYVDLPPVGRQVKAGEPFGEVESVKAVSDLYSPVDGESSRPTRPIADNLDHLADDPYGTAGWSRSGQQPRRPGQAAGLTRPIRSSARKSGRNRWQ